MIVDELVDPHFRVVSPPLLLLNHGKRVRYSVSLLLKPLVVVGHLLPLFVVPVVVLDNQRLSEVRAVVELWGRFPLVTFLDLVDVGLAEHLLHPVLDDRLEVFGVGSGGVVGSGWPGSTGSGTGVGSTT